MGHTRPNVLSRSLTLGAGLLALMAPTLQGGPELHEWSADLWSSAQRGDGTTVTRLAHGSDEPEIQRGPIGTDLETYAELTEEREATRLARLGELSDELSEALESPDYAEALRAILEMQDLENDPVGFVDRAEVRTVVDAAAGRAADYERRGEWLPAFRLYSMLHVLHEVDRRYEDDWLRLGQRRAMIGFYAPRTLYEMISDQRVAEGEPALPPYNESGPTWRDRVEGLRSSMVSSALKRASDRHIHSVPIKDMLMGGFDALTVMATTPELAGALPALADERKSRDFLERLEANRLAIEGLEEDLGFHHIDRALRILDRINNESLALPMEALLHEFGNGASAQLDEYSQFYWPETIERARRTTEGNFKGVGIQITQNDDLELEVVTPVAGTPAFRAGIRPGDIIAEIEGVSAIGLGVNDAVDRITGPAGTSVRLGVRRDGFDELIPFRLRREVIELYAARGWKRDGVNEDDWEWFVDEEAGIGYIRVSQFLNGATDQTTNAIRAMQRRGLNGVILDLRYNSGGLLNEAVDMTNLFLDGGVVVTQEDARGQVQDTQRAQRGRALLAHTPVIVLINGGSASASEIVAGALQDHERAVLVGDRTYGKGSVQRIFPLDRAGRAAFKLTTQYYKLPSGRLIHRRPGVAEWGIEPDVLVRMMPNEISDALELRRDADIVNVDDQGNTVAEAADPAPLLEDGMDPQLQTAVLLLRAKIVGDREAQQAGLH